MADLRANPSPASPLFAQRGLNFAHPDQRAEVLHLSADLRHVQAAHVVEVLVGPSRLTVREEPRLQRPRQPPSSCGVSLFPSQMSQRDRLYALLYIDGASLRCACGITLCPQ